MLSCDHNASWQEGVGLEFRALVSPAAGRPAAGAGSASDKIGNRKTKGQGARAGAAGRGEGGGDGDGCPDAIAKLPPGAAAAKLRARTVKAFGDMRAAITRANEKLLQLKGPGTGVEAAAKEADSEHPDDLRLNARALLLSRLTNNKEMRTRDKGSVELQTELWSQLQMDPYYSEMAVTQNWQVEGIWTTGMITYFQNVEMNCLASAIQVYNRHMVCMDAVAIITEVARSIVQEIGQRQANLAAEEKALKEEENAKKILGCVSCRQLQCKIVPLR